MLEILSFEIIRGKQLLVLFLLTCITSATGVYASEHNMSGFAEFEGVTDSSRLSSTRIKQGVGFTDSVYYQLTPTLSVVTKPLGKNKNNVNVAIYSASVVIFQMTLTQAAPFAKVTTEIVLGTDKIEAGMELTLQVPSAIQPGSILMTATFSSLNVPPTGISAMVAIWNL